MRNDRRLSLGQWITPIARMADLRTVSDVLAFIAFWPLVALAGWILIDPYGFGDAVLRVLGVQ